MGLANTLKPSAQYTIRLSDATESLASIHTLTESLISINPETLLIQLEEHKYSDTETILNELFCSHSL